MVRVVRLALPVVLAAACGGSDPTRVNTPVDVALTPPSLAAVSPEVAEWDDLLHITGAGLALYSLSGSVRIGGATADIDAWLDDSIDVRMPAGVEPGEQALVVTAGAHELSLQVAVRPTLVAASFGVDGRIVLDGINLGSAAGSVALSGAGVPQPAIVAWSPTSVVASVAPRLPSGIYSVSLTNGYPALRSIDIAVTARVAAPIDMSAGAGDIVALDGAHFGAGATVTVGGAAVEIVTATPARIEFRPGPSVPPGVQPIVVWSGGTAIPAGTLTIEPVLTGVNPTTAPAGATVVLSGTNFGPTENGGFVSIGGQTAEVLAWSAQAIQVRVPALAAGPAAVQVTAGGRASNVLWSEVAAAVVAPDALAATPATQPAVLLQWRDNSSDETGFELERRAGAGPYAAIAVLAAGVTRYTDFGVAAGVAYGYRVRAVRAGLASAFSPEAALHVPLIWDLWGGFEHGCAATWGHVRCWGDNTYAQLGTGAASAASITAPAPLPFFAAPVSGGFAGSHHTCAIAADGRLFCWGRNNRGQIGAGISVALDVTAPVPVGSLAGVAAGAGGGAHSCALAAGGIYCWGENANGQLGNGVAGGYAAFPARVTGLAGAEALSTRFAHVCALKHGQAYCWGLNNWGQTGIGATTPLSVTWPTLVAGITGAIGIAAGIHHACALLSDGTVRCWGRNTYGQLGAMLLASTGAVTQPTSVASPLRYDDGLGAWSPEYAGPLTGVVELAAGFYHTCALTSAGRVYCWGQNAADSNQLGVAATPHACFSIPCSQAPVAVALERPAARLSAGLYHTCAIDLAGDAVCWGRNTKGQAGDGTRATTPGAHPLYWP